MSATVDRSEMKLHNNNHNTSDITIGVLALQGAFLEHIITLQKFNIHTIEVRTSDDTLQCDGLVLPGGESTTMANVAERWGLIEPLKQYVQQQHKPIFGTCAGLILLSNNIHNQKQNGQLHLGGLSITSARNFYPNGQLGSFEGYYNADILQQRYGGQQQTHAVFIRAPGIIDVNTNECDILCSVPRDDIHNIGHQTDNVIAVRQGNILATTFHPELTKDDRWHRLFIDLVRYDKKQRQQRS